MNSESGVHEFVIFHLKIVVARLMVFGCLLPTSFAPIQQALVHWLLDARFMGLSISLVPPFWHPGRPF